MTRALLLLFLVALLAVSLPAHAETTARSPDFELRTWAMTGAAPADGEPLSESASFVMRSRLGGPFVGHAESASFALWGCGAYTPVEAWFLVDATADGPVVIRWTVEALGGAVLVGVQVGVPVLGQALVGAGDLFRGGRGGDAEQLVVVVAGLVADGGHDAASPRPAASPPTPPVVSRGIFLASPSSSISSSRALTSWTWLKRPPVRSAMPRSRASSKLTSRPWPPPPTPMVSITTPIRRARAADGWREKLNYVVEEIYGEGVVQGLKLRHTKTGEAEDLPCDGVFGFIGYSPASGSVSHLVQTDDMGYIVTDRKLRTSVKGIWACGDIVEGSLKQMVVSAGNGATAAIDIREHLASEGD